MAWPPKSSGGTTMPGRFDGSLARNRPRTGMSAKDSARMAAAAVGTKSSGLG